jgi:hypothetical protein
MLNILSVRDFRHKIFVQKHNYLYLGQATHIHSDDEPADSLGQGTESNNPLQFLTNSIRNL